MRIQDLRNTYGYEYPSRQGGVGAINMFIAHHAETQYPATEQQAIQQVATIDAYHKNTNGWPGFAYHGAIWEDVFLWCKDWVRLGYHSAGHDISPRNGIGDNNDHGIAVVWLGTYSTGPGPKDLLLKTMGEVRLKAISDVGRDLPLLGHQDVWPTACPGEWWASGKKRVIDLAAPQPTDPAFEPEVVRLINVSGYLSGDVVRIDDHAARINEANRVRVQDLGMEPIA